MIYTEEELKRINISRKAVPGRVYEIANGDKYLGKNDGSLVFYADSFSLKARNAVGEALVESGNSKISYDPAVPSFTPDLKNTTVVAGEYGDESNIPKVTVDEKGRVTGIEEIPVTYEPMEELLDEAEEALSGMIRTDREEIEYNRLLIRKLIWTLEMAGIPVEDDMLRKELSYYEP